MDNDFTTLYEILEMAEVLSAADEDSLEVVTVDEHSGKTATVVFYFNKDKELTGVNVVE